MAMADNTEAAMAKGEAMEAAEVVDMVEARARTNLWVEAWASEPVGSEAARRTMEEEEAAARWRSRGATSAAVERSVVVAAAATVEVVEWAVAMAVAVAVG